MEAHLSEKASEREERMLLNVEWLFGPLLWSFQAGSQRRKRKNLPNKHTWTEFISKQDSPPTHNCVFLNYRASDTLSLSQPCLSFPSPISQLFFIPHSLSYFTPPPSRSPRADTINSHIQPSLQKWEPRPFLFEVINSLWGVARSQKCASVWICKLLKCKSLINMICPCLPIVCVCLKATVHTKIYINFPRYSKFQQIAKWEMFAFPHYIVKIVTT